MERRNQIRLSIFWIRNSDRTQSRENYTAFTKRSDAEFMQYRRPVGLGPSSNTWPRCASHSVHATAIRSVPSELSWISRTFSFAIGSQKLGQPVPASNFVAELNSALSQQMQRYIPLTCTFQSFPLYANSVSACRVISNTPEGNCFLPSASVFTTFAILTFSNRSPVSENLTIVTSPGVVLASATIS